MKKKEKRITIGDIKAKCKERGYQLTEKDEQILKEMDDLSSDKNAEYYNKYMLYGPNKKSIYVPHIIMLGMGSTVW